MEKANTTIQKEHRLIRNKFMKGVRLSFKRLVSQAALNDDELLFVVDNKVKAVRARKIKI